MIEFKNVSKAYGKEFSALNDVSFAIEKGSFVFLVGPTGSGKTTIFRLIIRDILPTGGQVVLGDWDIAKMPKGKVPHLRRKVGTVFQDLKLLMDRTVLENVILPLQFSGALEKQITEKASEILTQVGLDDKKDKFPLQLSGGERQRIAVARALIFDPEVILADEPTGNLDLQTSYQILDLLENINKRGTTVFMATHNDALIGKANHRVISLSQGKITDDKNKRPKSYNKEKEDSHSPDQEGEKIKDAV